VNNNFLETIKAVDGKIYNILYHQQRYEDVLKDFGMWEYKNLYEYINPPKNGVYRCRLTYSLNPHAINVVGNGDSKKKISSLKIVYDNIKYCKKYSNRDELDKLYKLKDECDDILMVKDSLITDTSIANIAFFDGLFWLTPKLPLLKGTTRQRLLDDGKIQEANICVNDLKKFKKVALLNAMIDFDIISKITFKH